MQTLKPLRIFITGLCLQGNKGGPAIALSLIKQHLLFLDNLEFVFSVPQIDLKEEKLWGEKYNIKVVGNLEY